MTRSASPRIFIVACALTLLVSAPAPAAPTYQATYTSSSNWGSGFTGGITILNTGTTPIEDWTLAFDFNRSITSVWNGVLLNASGGRYTVDNAGWNATIAPGASANFGFQGGGGPTPAASNYELILPEPPPPPQFEMDYSIVNDWGTGFQAEVTIRNVGTSPISGWTLAFDLIRTVTQAWNATLGQAAPSRPSFASLSYNSQIAAGGSTSFGFLASGSGATPTNIRLNDLAPIPEPAGAMLSALVLLLRRRRTA